MPIQIHDPKLLLDLMALEHLERHNGSVLHKIVDDATMEHLDGAIIARVGEQRQATLMEAHLADSLLVISKRLIRASAEVEIVPEETSIVGADDEVVTAGVDVDGGDPASAGLDNLEELLTDEVIETDGALGGDEQERFRGVKLRGLWEALEATKGQLGEVFREGVDGHGGRGGGGRWSAGREVVAAPVEGEGLDSVTEVNGDEDGG
jgi:hypothetical protein